MKKAEEINNKINNKNLTGSMQCGTAVLCTYYRQGEKQALFFIPLIKRYLSFKRPLFLALFGVCPSSYGSHRCTLSLVNALPISCAGPYETQFPSRLATLSPSLLLTLHAVRTTWFLSSSGWFRGLLSRAPSYSEHSLRFMNFWLTGILIPLPFYSVSQAPLCFQNRSQVSFPSVVPWSLSKKSEKNH